MTRKTSTRLACVAWGLIMIAQSLDLSAEQPADAVTLHGSGLHGYIGFETTMPPNREEYAAGVGFYSAVWPLIDQPLEHFQIGLASTWISPDNSDNKDTPLAPVGTYARDHWPERAPTYGAVFQTVEGGLGYWAGNQFRYGPPKFSMNATPQCYDYEVGSPGWSFFRGGKPLPDNRLSVAQLSNRLLIPPDGLPFAGNPMGEFFGYTYMALPLTSPVAGDLENGVAPTGDQAWTCFISAENFRGPIAYYIPETWSKIGTLFNYPYIFGRGLDTRGGDANGGAMEINTVPRFDAQDASGVGYSKIPKLQFPVDDQGRSMLVQDVTFYSKSALYDAVKDWREGGEVCPPEFAEAGAFHAKLTTRRPRYDLSGKPIEKIADRCDTQVFDNNVWGLTWSNNPAPGLADFPQYYRHENDRRVAVDAADVPAETGLLDREFASSTSSTPYKAAIKGAWKTPGPSSEIFTVDLADGSTVQYRWYRFVDQPSLQQYHFGGEKQQQLQSLVEQMHANWTIDSDYMPPPTHGKRVNLDPALIVTPPAGKEVGYVPIVTGQYKTTLN